MELFAQIPDLDFCPPTEVLSSMFKKIVGKEKGSGDKCAVQRWIHKRDHKDQAAWNSCQSLRDTGCPLCILLTWPFWFRRTIPLCRQCIFSNDWQLSNHPMPPNHEALGLNNFEKQVCRR